jgi:hypothetical protein
MSARSVALRRASIAAPSRRTRCRLGQPALVLRDERHRFDERLHLERVVGFSGFSKRSA